jgi:hypothetical protein
MRFGHSNTPPFAAWVAGLRGQATMIIRIFLCLIYAIISCRSDILATPPFWAASGARRSILSTMTYLLGPIAHLLRTASVRPTVETFGSAYGRDRTSWVARPCLRLPFTGRATVLPEVRRRTTFHLNRPLAEAAPWGCPAELLWAAQPSPMSALCPRCGVF